MSPSALVDAQAVLDENTPMQERSGSDLSRGEFEGIPNAGEAEVLEIFDVSGRELGDAMVAQGEG